MEACPVCSKPYGLRRRCYACQPGVKRSGEERACQVCGSTFYAPRWAINDTARNSGVYCSRACKYAGMTGKAYKAPRKPYITSSGYRMLSVGYRAHKLEHRVVVEASLGRELRDDEEVHHINGDKLDNRLENLLIVSPSEHQTYHSDRWVAMRRRILLVCERCGVTFERRPKRAGQRFCSRSCRSKATGGFAQKP